jgi:hypothetical protein
MSTTASDSTPTETEDRLAIIEVIGRLALLLDAKDWDALEGLFTDPIYSDRTSLCGGEPQTRSSAEFVGGWRYALANLDAIHHLITGHVSGGRLQLGDRLFLEDDDLAVLGPMQMVMIVDHR